MVLSHDRWVQFLASHFCKMGVINGPLVHYRQHSDNAYGAKRTTLKDKILTKTLEGPYSFGQLTKIANRRVEMLETNRTKNRESAFDLAIARWKSVRRFYELRFRLYSSRHLAIRFVLLVQCFFEGAYLPNRYQGLGLKRFLIDLCFGLLGPSLGNWLAAKAKK